MRCKKKKSEKVKGWDEGLVKLKIAEELEGLVRASVFQEFLGTGAGAQKEGSRLVGVDWRCDLVERARTPE